MGKIEENKRLKKEALYNSAYELFTQNGVSHTTISDIVDYAGIAKGTFYLYFKDKFEICRQLIRFKTNEVFQEAHSAVCQTQLSGFTEQLHYVIDYVISYLEKDPLLLGFISRNFDHSTFKISFKEKTEDDSFNFYQIYLELLKKDVHRYKEPEFLFFTLIELVSSTCCSCILNNQPVPISKYRPYLHEIIDAILRCFLE